MIERLLDRLYRAISYSDLGVPTSILNKDMLVAANRALSRTGGGRLSSLEDAGAVRRAVQILEENSE